MKRLALLLAMVTSVAALSSAPAHAQVHEPARGSAERAHLLEVLRRATPQLGIRQTVEFREVTMRVSGDWAFVRAVPAHPGGRALRYCERQSAELPGDEQIDALLYRFRGQWTVVEQHICLTDWPFLPDRGGARYRAVMGFNESARFPSAARLTDTDDGFVALRSAPSLQRGQRLLRMPERSAVTVLACEDALDRVEGKWDRWCHVRYGNRTGYAPLSLIELSY